MSYFIASDKFKGSKISYTSQKIRAQVKFAFLGIILYSYHRMSADEVYYILEWMKDKRYYRLEGKHVGAALISHSDALGILLTPVS